MLDLADDAARSGARWMAESDFSDPEAGRGGIALYDASMSAEREAAECVSRAPPPEHPPAIAVPLVDGLFTVIGAGQAFASEAEAAGALRSVASWRQGHGLAAWRGGWLILPAGLAPALAP